MHYTKENVSLIYGTAEYLANKLGVEKETIFYMATPRHKKRDKRKSNDSN